MKESWQQLDRLLRAAVAPDDAPVDMPFGFDSRVVAYWQAGGVSDFVDVRRLLRRVVFLSLAVIALALAGAYQEFGPGGETEPLLDQYAIADSAISGAFNP
ncbi:hypothetical protein BH20VER3_BH20VER3_12590 [soil metagenome]